MTNATDPPQEIQAAEYVGVDGYTDPILEEIWAVREKIAAEFDYDVGKMARFHMEYQKQFGARVIPPPETK